MDEQTIDRMLCRLNAAKESIADAVSRVEAYRDDQGDYDENLGDARDLIAEALTDLAAATVLPTWQARY